MYNYQWFVGDRTSIISYGWFEFWNLTGKPASDNYNVPGYNPQGSERDHDRDLAEPPAAGERVPRLHGDQHRADQHLGPERVGVATG